MRTTERPLIKFDLVRHSLCMGVCPDCGKDEFLAGPCGGLCQNIKCAVCGSEFNFCPPCFAMPIGYAERIGRRAGFGLGTGSAAVSHVSADFAGLAPGCPST